MSDLTYRDELDQLKQEWFVESIRWKRDDPSPDDWSDDVLEHHQQHPLDLPAPLRVNVEWNGPARRPVEVINNFWSRPFISFADAAEWLRQWGSRIPPGLANALSSGQLIVILRSMRGRCTENFRTFVGTVRSLHMKIKNANRKKQRRYRQHDQRGACAEYSPSPLDFDFGRLSFGDKRLNVSGWLTTDYQYG